MKDWIQLFPRTILKLRQAPRRCHFSLGINSIRCKLDAKQLFELMVCIWRLDASMEHTTVSSMLVVSALADATMVVIELRELSKRIYACTMYFIHFNISHGALLAVINM